MLDLTDPQVRSALGLEVREIVSDDIVIPQAIGEAAHDLGIEAIVAPSATGGGTTLALFIDNRAPESVIEVVETGAHQPHE